MVAVDVVARYQQALRDGEFEIARALLKDDLRFKGPFDEFETADDFSDAIRGLWKIVQSVEIRHMSSNGDEVVVLYDMVTTTPAGAQLVCEWYGVQGTKIVWIRALFDSAPFAFLRDGKRDGAG